MAPPSKRQKETGNPPAAPAAAVDEVPIGNHQLCFKSELALHKDPPVRQNCVRESEWVITDPVSSLMDGEAQIVNFILPLSSDGCYDLSNCRLRVDLQIVDKDRSKVKSFLSKKVVRGEGGAVRNVFLDENQYDPVAVVNNTAGSLWEKVSVAINDVSVASSNTSHHYKSFIQNSVNFSDNERETGLAGSGYVPDSGIPDSVKDPENSGMLQRARYTENGGIYKLCGRLSHDLFCVTQVMPIGTKIAITLHKNHDELLLMVDPEKEYHLQKRYKVLLKKVQMEALRIRLAPETISIMERSLASSAAKYHFVRTEMRSFYVAPNSKSNYQHNLFLGQKPSRMLLGFVPVSAYQGTYTTNPLCFKPNNVSQLILRVDNRIIGQPLNIDWGNKSGCLYAYLEYLRTLRVQNKHVLVEPKLSHYPVGPLTLFGWDLSKDFSDASGTEQCGSVSLETNFSGASGAGGEGLVGIVLAMFFGSMHVDSFGNVEVFDDFQK